MMYHLLFFFLKLLSYIPFGVLYVLSNCLFYPIYYIVRYRRKVVRKNLTESFPEKSEQEIKRIEKEFYRFFVDQVLESCKMMTISPEEISRRMKFTNVEAANAVFRKGKSIALYMGPYGNWEWVPRGGLHNLAKSHGPGDCLPSPPPSPGRGRYGGPGRPGWR